MLTVIVPTYNAEPYLSQAIDSLLNENKIELEILAINDGSTDNSLAIMQDFAARDSRVRVIDKANQGYGATCNLGIREAMGDWIAILEPDDWIEPGMYSDMFAFAKREFGGPNKLDIIETPYWIIRNPDTPQEVKLHCAYRGRIKPSRQPFTIHDAPHLLAHHPSIWSAIYRRDFLMQNNIWFKEIPGAGWADNPFLVETLCQAKAIAYWPKPYYCYREETPEKAAALAKRDPLMPFNRWNDMVDILERLNVTDPAVWTPQITRGFTYMGIMIEHTGIDGHPEIERAIHRMFERMPQELVFANPRITPAAKKLYAEYMGIANPKISYCAYAKDLVGEGLYNVWNKGPKQTLKMITSHFGSYNARAGNSLMGSKTSRNTSIEALRLVAVAGIAVFHTFQWTFQAVCISVPEYAPLAAFPYSGLLGFINLLGCWANEVFFMISGYFLIASAARAWDGGATWKSQMQRTAQRLGKVIMPTAFYCLVALAWSTVVSPIPDVALNTHNWYTLGLEFIWVYAATVFMAPWFGLARSRLPRKSYTATVIAVGILAFVVNGYLAAMSATSAGEFSWLQKFMSTVTYVVAFLIGGLLRDVTDVMDSDRVGALGMRSLVTVLVLTIILEGALSFTDNLTAMTILSYKSTSLISFALAAACLLFAATRRSASGNPRTAGVIVTLSTATLGFYVMQSLTSSLWRPVFNTLLANILVSQNSPVAIYIFTGTVISIVFALALLIIDAARSFIARKLKRQ